MHGRLCLSCARCGSLSVVSIHLCSAMLDTSDSNSTDDLRHLYQTEYWCPRKLNTCESGYYSLVNGTRPSYTSLVSCTLSCLGSLLIVYSYWRWKDIRTGSRSIITFLAIADFFTAAGYIIAAGNYLKYFGEYEATPQCVVFRQICEMQSYITTWSSMSSFAWTSALAIYLYLTIVHGRILLANRLIPLFHVIAWVLPIVICLPLLLTENLGFSKLASSNWCFIRGTNDLDSSFPEFRYRTVLYSLLAGKLWEMLTYVLVIVLYVWMRCHIRRESKSGQFPTRVATAALKLDRKLIFIPVIFFILRIWGTIEFFYAIGVAKHNHYGCIPYAVWRGFWILGHLQAAGDGGQGWGNAILYIFASKTIRERLFGWLYNPLRHCCVQLISRVYPPRNPESSNQRLLPNQQNNDIMIEREFDGSGVTRYSIQGNSSIEYESITEFSTM